MVFFATVDDKAYTCTSRRTILIQRRKLENTDLLWLKRDMNRSISYWNESYQCRCSFWFSDRFPVKCVNWGKVENQSQKLQNILCCSFGRGIVCRMCSDEKYCMRICDYLQLATLVAALSNKMVYRCEIHERWKRQENSQFLDIFDDLQTFSWQ